MVELKKSKISKLNRKIAIVTAFLSLLLGLIYYNNHKKQQAEIQSTYEQVKTALKMVSVNYNKGTEKMKYLERFDDATNKVINLENLK
ncbi:MAG: hypothetical protein Q4B43_04305 [Bacteroidota bacterium]|nr:hypothetical protein [Bacteroidota bacterium]